MVDLSPKLMFQVMNNCPCSCYRLQHLRAAKSIQRFGFEMLAQREDRLFWQKGVAVIAKRTRDFRKLLLLIITNEKFRRANTRDFVEQRLPILQLGYPELACAEIGIRKTEDTSSGIDRAQIICALGFEQVEIAYRARADDLRDIARNDFSWLRFARLVTDGYAPACLDELCDGSLRCVIGHATHGHAVPLRQRDVQ